MAERAAITTLRSTVGRLNFPALNRRGEPQRLLISSYIRSLTQSPAAKCYLCNFTRNQLCPCLLRLSSCRTILNRNDILRLMDALIPTNNIVVAAVVVVNYRRSRNLWQTSEPDSFVDGIKGAQFHFVLVAIARVLPVHIILKPEPDDHFWHFMICLIAQEGRCVRKWVIVIREMCSGNYDSMHIPINVRAIVSLFSYECVRWVRWCGW